jgi:calcineurin-like phosphoesterase family protein
LNDLPILVVGDVHGDIERLFQALKPYPAEEWHTVFLGDLVDGGAFGVGALRYARDRANSTVLLGNHEVAMLRALRDRSELSFWLSIGGQLHDLKELEKDEELQEWLRTRPLLHRSEDGTLLQHSDTDYYARLADREDEDVIESVNAEAARLLRDGDESALWDILAPGMIFRTSRTRLESWLERTRSYRVVHGHKPHGLKQPDVYQNGLAICFDGGLSRYYRSRFLRRTPLSASVGPLPHW